MKILEASNGLMARMVEQSDYDGIWVSSLCHSASLGLPDNELVPLSDRVELVKQIRRVSTKPIIVDIDTGGDIAHLPTIIKWFSDAGAWAVVMEDKKGLKQNSLLDSGKHELEDIDVFCEKIRACKNYAVNSIVKENKEPIKIFARLESLIAKKSKYEAILRGRAYWEAGANGIMVHSKVKADPTEVLEVAHELRKEINDDYLYLIAVPTTYTLPKSHGFDIVIDANQMTRASLKAMTDFVTGKNVELAPVQQIFELCGK